MNSTQHLKLKNSYSSFKTYTCPEAKTIEKVKQMKHFLSKYSVSPTKNLTDPLNMSVQCCVSYSQSFLQVYMQELKETLKIPPSEKSYQALAHGCKSQKQGLWLLDNMKV